MDFRKLSPFALELINHCQKRPSSLVFPEGHDPRVMEAARLLLEHNCVSTLTLITPEANAQKLANQHQPAFPKNDPRLIWLDAQSLELRKKTASAYQVYLDRRDKKATAQQIELWASHPANQAAALVHHNIVDCAVGGCIFTTAEIIRATLQGIGLRKGNKTISSCFAMIRQTETADERYIFSDCGVVIDPSVDQLVDIATDSVQTFRQLFPSDTPRVAFLSFSTQGSASHPSAEKMFLATKEFKQKFPDLLVDGELQFDAAFVPEVSRRKCPDSPLKGRANCFIFPNLDAGNIAYKITQRLASFQAIGPILQGSACPYSDLSRGASAEDILLASLITMLRKT